MNVPAPKLACLRCDRRTGVKNIDCERCARTALLRARGVAEVTVPGDIATTLRLQLQQALKGEHFTPEMHAATMQTIGALALRLTLPPEQLEVFSDFGSDKFAALVVRDFKLPDQIPPTPSDTGFTADYPLQFADTILLGAMALSGYAPIAYVYENLGKLFRNVCPVRDGEKSSQGAKVDLAWHTDNYLDDFESEDLVGGTSPIPKLLAFLGLRNADEAGAPVPTDVLPVAAVLRELSKETKAELEKPHFRLYPAASNTRFPREGAALLSPNTPGKAIHAPFRFNAEPGKVEGLTSGAVAALEELAYVVAVVGTTSVAHIALAPGDVLLLNNYMALHNRRAFVPGPDRKSARWLRRVFGTQNPAAGTYVDPTHAPFLWA